MDRDKLSPVATERENSRTTAKSNPPTATIDRNMAVCVTSAYCPLAAGPQRWPSHQLMPNPASTDTPRTVIEAREAPC